MTEQPNAAQQPQPPYRRLRRSQVDRKIGGVCGGVGEYFGVDPTLVRVAFLVLTVLTGGTFLLAYLLAFLVVPDGMALPDQPVWQAQPPVR
jgi:phage shock protein C